MGFGNTNAAAGGTSLNFEVVGGTTEPTNPKENMIWVNTSNKITGWHFSATQPENMVEGEVWFATGTSSDVAFNALEKNDIYVYPLKAAQYVNSELNEVTAKFYQGGEWRLLVHELYLYDNGVFDDADGGLQQVGVPYAGGGAGTCEITPGESSVTIKTNGGTSALVYFPTKRDLTHFKTLYFDGSFVKSSESNSGSFGLGVWKTIPTSDASTEASAILEGFRSQSTHALDISNCTGEHYIGIVAYGFGSKYACTATMKQMYLK